MTHTTPTPDGLPADQLEAAAKAVYDALPADRSGDPKTFPWQPGGNSIRQDEARRYARAALGTIAQAAPAGDSSVTLCDEVAIAAEMWANAEYAEAKELWRGGSSDGEACAAAEDKFRTLLDKLTTERAATQPAGEVVAWWNTKYDSVMLMKRLSPQLGGMVGIKSSPAFIAGELVPLFAAPISEDAGNGEPHDWGGDGELCAKCGDKDWFAGPVCSGKSTAPSDSTEQRAATAAKDSGEVVEILLEVARLAHDAMDSTEDTGIAMHWNKEDFDALSAAMDKLDALPDDQPGYIMGPAAKAAWAMRVHAAPISEDAGEGAATAAKDSGEVTYVHSVPDHCDRITWRGHYHHLPLTATSAPDLSAQQPAVRWPHANSAVICGTAQQPAAASVDGSEFQRLAMSYRKAPNPHSTNEAGPHQSYAYLVAHINAWGAQQREAGWVNGRRDQYAIALQQRDRAEAAEKERDDLRAQLAVQAEAIQRMSAGWADLAGLTRYDGGITDHEWGSVGLVEKPVGRAVLLADVQALLAGGAKDCTHPPGCKYCPWCGFKAEGFTPGFDDHAGALQVGGIDYGVKLGALPTSITLGEPVHHITVDGMVPDDGC